MKVKKRYSTIGAIVLVAAFALAGCTKNNVVATYKNQNITEQNIQVYGELMGAPKISTQLIQDYATTFVLSQRSSKNVAMNPYFQHLYDQMMPRVELLTVTKAELTPTQSMPMSYAKKAYKTYQDNYVKLPTYTLSYFEVPSQAVASQVIKSLESGKSEQVVASSFKKQFAQKPVLNQTRSLTEFQNPAIVNYLQSLKEGQVLKPVSVILRNGDYMVLDVQSFTTKNSQTFEEAKAQFLPFIESQYKEAYKGKVLEATLEKHITWNKSVLANIKAGKKVDSKATLAIVSKQGISVKTFLNQEYTGLVNPNINDLYKDQQSFKEALVRAFHKQLITLLFTDNKLNQSATYKEYNDTLKMMLSASTYFQFAYVRKMTVSQAEIDAVIKSHHIQITAKNKKKMMEQIKQYIQYEKGEMSMQKSLKENFAMIHWNKNYFKENKLEVPTF